MTQILVVDDEPDMLILIKNILKKHGYQVDTYRNPDEVQINQLAIYDLILLDVMMPKIDGISFCEQIRNQVDCPIIFLTAKTQEDDIVAGLESGADDYLTKPFGMQELLMRIEAHLRREKRPRHVSLYFDNLHFDLTAKEVTVNGEVVPLTKSEYKLCEILARRQGQVFSKDQLYEQTFGLDAIGDASAIAEHIKNIRAKFHKFNLTPITTVWGVGYKWR